MPDSKTHSAQFCSDLVRNRDEDRWLSAQYAPANDTRKLMALYAFRCELRHIPAAVSEPPLGEIRLQWWRDAFQELRECKPPRAHPVVEEISATGLADQKFAAHIDKAIDAAARPLYGEPFSDLADLVSWLDYAEGHLDLLAASALGASTEVGQFAAQAGVAFALAREGRHLAPELGDAITARSKEIQKLTFLKLRHAPASLAPVLLHLSLTNDYLTKSAKPFPIWKRLKLLSAMVFGVR